MHFAIVIKTRPVLQTEFSFDTVRQISNLSLTYFILYASWFISMALKRLGEDYELRSFYYVLKSYLN
jgi:hypothetical protein